MRKKIVILSIIFIIMGIGGNGFSGQAENSPITAEYIGQDVCVINSYLWSFFDSIYRAIYYDKKSGQYYKVTNIIETNNVFYKYNPRKKEKVFRPNMREFEERLLYVGNISEYDRVYIDTNDNTQYIKTLIPLKFDSYNIINPQDSNHWMPKSRVLEDSRLYPVLNDGLNIFFTNKSGLKLLMLIDGTLQSNISSVEQ